MPDLISIREEAERLGKLGQLNPNELPFYYENGENAGIHQVSTQQDLIKTIIAKGNVTLDEHKRSYPDQEIMASIIKRMGWE